ncbi:leishmanolysin-related zinc metalloendopeptidase [Jannaschia donghaensis]|uniref:Leishmanolysin n=1 Tax=Jannaschia donghaensis TaxID=420998 RepID=A0A0M6YMH5_9RHOB|nr:leishmanolysin-related zinc metalloendopeptidase [Jannaschia donghaensis]CTQ51140.1 Leishmanolysin [Jannaschia donghaensis]
MITLSFSGDFPAARRAVFERAAVRWDEIITTQFDPITYEGVTITGMRIDASVVDIDGAEGVLGRAGPTVLRAGSELPLIGVMEFDRADVVDLEGAGSFEDVILHEMAHVLGFGTLWSRRNLIAGAGSIDPRFIGPAASREFALLDADGGSAVPVANTGGAGTRDGHWRELIFGDELLTGFLSGTGRPLSRMSIASFEDLGYAVDYGRADDFVLPGFRDLALKGVPEAVRSGILCRMERPEPIVLRQDES